MMSENLKRSSSKVLLIGLASIVLFSVNRGISAPARSSDIVDTALAAGSFKTLAAALEAAGLVEALKGEGPFGEEEHVLATNDAVNSDASAPHGYRRIGNWE